jgi:putative copper export protein
VGGLIALVTFVPTLRHIQDSAPLLQCLIGRFGRIAIVASIVVLLSGVLQGALEVGSLTALVASLYGQLLLVKAVLLLAMLSLAGFNEWQARSTRTVAQVRAFGRGVRVELTLGVIVFAVAAMLSGTPPSPNG